MLWSFQRLLQYDHKYKDGSEIAKIKRACEVIHMGHNAVLETLKEGITELELVTAVENAHRLAGHEGIFSDGHVVALDMHMMDENVGVVKLEDMILITDNGNEILTKSPRDLFEL